MKFLMMITVNIKFFKQYPTQSKSYVNVFYCYCRYVEKKLGTRLGGKDSKFRFGTRYVWNKRSEIQGEMLRSQIYIYIHTV